MDPKFRKELSRVKSPSYRRESFNNQNDVHANMPGQSNGADERTGLLGGHSNGSVARQDTLKDFFLNKRHTAGMDSDNKAVKISAEAWHVTKVTLLSNYVNILLVFVPLGIVAGLGKWNPTVVFILNFFAIVPLAAVLSFATEEISMKLGQTMGGLLNATFGNAVELIVSAFLGLKHLQAYLTISLTLCYRSALSH